MLRLSENDAKPMFKGPMFKRQPNGRESRHRRRKWFQQKNVRNWHKSDNGHKAGSIWTLAPRTVDRADMGIRGTAVRERRMLLSLTHWLTKAR